MGAGDTDRLKSIVERKLAADEARRKQDEDEHQLALDSARQWNFAKTKFSGDLEGVIRLVAAQNQVLQQAQLELRTSQDEYKDIDREGRFTITLFEDGRPGQKKIVFNLRQTTVKAVVLLSHTGKSPPDISISAVNEDYYRDAIISFLEQVFPS